MKCHLLLLRQTQLPECLLLKVLLRISLVCNVQFGSCWSRKRAGNRYSIVISAELLRNINLFKPILCGIDDPLANPVIVAVLKKGTCYTLVSQFRHSRLKFSNW